MGFLDVLQLWLGGKQDHASYEIFLFQQILFLYQLIFFLKILRLSQH